jgi:adenylate cyclase
MGRSYTRYSPRSDVDVSAIRIVLGEDNVLVREGVRALLDSFPDVEVVGVAEDAPSLLATAAEHAPDVVVTDIKMPPTFRLEGIDCAHEIRSRHPDTGVVVLSAHDDEEYALALLGQGHSGLAYLLKDRIAQGDELVRAIREVAAGGSTIDPVIAERLSGRRDADQADREILDMMARGAGYAEMAASLETTQEAVDRRVTELFGRMAGGDGRSQAVEELKRMHAALVDQASSARALRSYVPQQFADKLALSPSVPIEPQEAEVTVLFSDIRGFSTIAERLSAREIAEVVGRHLGAMAEVVVAHGGTLDKFAGDAVMAVFGAPDPVEDHAERALRCALAMQHRQDELNAQGWGVGVPELHMGIGVNTGTVIAGTIGGGGRLEYTVVGDAVNVAQRLQSEASGGEVVATAGTIAAAPRIDAESIGPRQVKGRSEPVEVYRVLDVLEGSEGR